jgi:hypothetical protein
MNPTHSALMFFVSNAEFGLYIPKKAACESKI